MIIQNMFKWLSLMLLLQILACKKDCPVDGQIVMVSNPSFEGEPAEGTQFQQFNLNNWIDCSISGQTSPDIHPGQGDGFFGVTTLPFDGETYLGLVVRDNNTWE